MKNPKFELREIVFDVEAGAGYVYFKDIGEGEAVRQVEVCKGLIFDVGSDGRLLGMEILSHSVLKKLEGKGVRKVSP